MPFTFAHPAAVVPIYRCAGRATTVLSALIVGSMVPDFDYVMPLGLGRGFTHSLPGLLMYCLPMGLILYLAYHALIKPVVVSLLPHPIRQRLAGSGDATWLSLQSLPWVALSVLLGALTHVLWDSFTHQGAFFVSRLPVLRTAAFEVAGHPVALYSVLQHCSTAVGLALLLRWTLRWYRETPPAPGLAIWNPPAPLRKAALIAIAMVPAAAVARAAITYVRYADDATTMEILKLLTRFGVITGMKAGVAILCTLGLLWRLLEMRAVGTGGGRSNQE
jgi:membrane-bound metal-dependent hydrolase YbcI (DUF457 family)